jgi:drug/metabolite transporter (DMT)-like permease
MAAAMVGLFANVGSSLLGRHLNRPANVSTVVVTALSMATGALMLAAVALPLEGLPRVSGRAWLIIGWLAVVNTAVAFTLWNLSLRRLSAVESAGINNTMLIQIALLAWLFLAEAPGWIGLVAIGIISLGVFLTQVSSAAGLDTQLDVADAEVSPSGGATPSRWIQFNRAANRK